MPRRGLPETISMRHDEHYVEALAASAGTPIGRLVPDRADRPEPEPAAAGDGRPVGADRVDRREGDHRAAGRAAARATGSRSSPASGATRRRCRSGLRELPVVIRDVDDTEMSGAGAHREPPAQGPDAVRRGGSAARPGRALRLHARGSWRGGWGSRGRRSPSRWRSTGCPTEVRNLCRLADISSKSLLLQVVRQDTPEKMTALIEKIASQGAAPPASSSATRRPSRRRAARSTTCLPTGRRPRRST